MGPQAIFWLLYSFYLASFLWDFYLTWRQYQVYRRTQKRPANVADIISEEDFEKARNYKLDKMHFGFFSMAFGKLESTFILFLNLMPWFWAACGRLSLSIWPESGEIFQTILFTCLSSIIGTISDLPFSYYDTFYIEQKHGFNKETVPFFFKDRLKKWLLGIVISTPVTAAYIFLVHWGGPNFYVYVWLFISAVIFVFMFIYPEFIAPLFDKYTPLPESPLRTKIEELAGRVSFPLTKIFVVEGSKRSAHSNAYMYGFWKNKRIVLYDTLLSEEMNQRMKAADGEGGKTKPENDTNSEKVKEPEEPAAESNDEKKRKTGMSDEEVVAVLGHELGHWKEMHSVFQLVISEINLFVMLLVFSFFYRQERLFVAFGFPPAEHPVSIGLLLVFQYVLGPYQELLCLGIVALSRRFEFAADRFAARLGYAGKLQSGLIKLGKDNLSLPIDDWLYSACNHSHPPIPERIEALKKFE